MTNKYVEVLNANNDYRRELVDLSSIGGGGDTSLPEVTSEDNGDVLAVVDGQWSKSAPSGGGAGFFIITTTDYNHDEDDWSEINHTFAEIQDAVYNNDQIPILYVTDGTYIAKVYYFDSSDKTGTFRFIRTEVSENSVVTDEVEVTVDDNVYQSTITFRNV